ncbi:hypothetical protein F5884DRAFT_513774 [Xylogone sp. PMI_703]|nr:hypothetical protein F5884DRAFT_513774 [Xylogone sp. PMI_703]
MSSSSARDSGPQGQDQARHSSPSLEQRRPQKARFRAVSYPRKRAITACESCRIRKTKCDNERPQCTSCAKNNLSCSYDPRLDHSSFDPASLLVLEKLNEVILKVDQISSSVGTRKVQPEHTFSEVVASVGSSQTPSQAVDQPCSIESLEVLAPFASTDSLLTWPIFAGRWPRDLLSRELLIGSIPTHSSTDESARPTRQHQKSGVREEDVPQLVDRFLQFVHPKNPILHIGQIREHARRVAEDGFGWDATSCIVLLTCALGAIAAPFDPASEAGQLHNRTSIEETSARRQTAEVYFQAARKRIGLLELGFTTSQCHMFSGIYLFYTLRPIQGWSAFYQAGSTLSLYLKAHAAVEARIDSTHHFSALSEKRLEQRLYWTVLKSECEIRTELDLPQSDLCKLEYPYLFPSPPSPSNPAQGPQDSFQTPASTTTPSSQTYSTASLSSYQRVEEQSWFYYLSEIALRRIENRILNMFYKADHHSWTQMDVEGMISAATSIEDQLAIWYSSLPDSIRFDNLATDQALDELRMVTLGRSVNMRVLLYRPFLYLAVHFTQRTSTNTSVAVEGFVKKALDLCVEFNSGHAMTHRHHGTWYGLRESTSMSLMLVAANMRGLITWTSPLHDGMMQENSYGRAIRTCIEKLRYWEAESPPDILRAREILEELFDCVD